MYELPTSLEIDGQSFAIRAKGDYRMVLDCFKALGDAELTESERIVACLVIFFEDLDDIGDIYMLPSIESAFKEVTRFFNCGGDESDGLKSKYKLVDWEGDESILTSAINNVAHTEIRLAPYIHWWTFMGYYMAIGDSTFSTVVSIRHKVAKGEKLEKYEKKFMSDNPRYFKWDFRTTEQKQFDEELRAMWGDNG